jgi:hypothetical protein
MASLLYRESQIGTNLGASAALANRIQNFTRSSNTPGTEERLSPFPPPAPENLKRPKLHWPLNNYDVISLPTPNGRGDTRAKRANQQSKEYPQQRMRYRFAGSICSLLSPHKNIRHPFLSVGWAESRSCRY